MKTKSKIVALLLAFAMVFTTAYVPASAKKVAVKKVTVASSLSGNTKTVVVAKGKSVKLATTVKVKPNKKANKKVSYSVKDSKVATVSAKGVVKGKKVGTTKVTVTSKKNKKKKATITVKVVKGAVTKVKLNKKKASLNVGEKLKLKTTVKAAKGAVKTIAYTTSKKKVATVNKKGVITAVGAGTAKITAKAIDGSGKKATIKVTVSDPINLTSMNVLNARTVTFALNKGCALNASQVSIKKKSYASGNYNYNLGISSLSTNDSVNYTAVLDNDSYIGVGAFVQVSIPSLTGSVKSLEMEYKDEVCAFTEEDISAWTVGTYGSDSFDFGYARGFSSYAISGVPAGLSATVKDDAIQVKGTPTTVGAMDATMTATDELGNTLTRTIHFIVGDDNTIVGAACQYYDLIGTGAVYASVSPTFIGGGGSYTYSVVADPSGILDKSDYQDGISTYGGTVYVKIPVAGTYTVTVRATSTKDATKYADVNIVFNVKQGITIGGCIKDAQGNPMSSDAYVKFTNKDRASQYRQSYNDSYYVDSKTATYSAIVEPGVYDIQASYNGDTSSEYAQSTKYLYSQSLQASQTGYDIQLDDIYKVVLTSADTSVTANNKTWYINGEKGDYYYYGVGTDSSGALYLKNGTYTLETGEIKPYDSGNTTTSGNWWEGFTVKTSGTETYKLTASVTVNGTAATAPVAKTVISTTEGTTTTKTGAKDTTYEATLNEPYYLSDSATYAYAFTPSEAGNYEISNSYVYFYEADGTGVAMEPNDDGSYTLKASTKYIVGAGGSSGSFTISEVKTETVSGNGTSATNTDTSGSETTN